MIRGTSLFVVIIGLAYSSFSQDIHFSQFLQSPLNLNPALAGDFDGDWRFGANYRDQWRSITSNPYQTFGFSVDARNPFGVNNTGIGLSFYTDQAGDLSFGTTQINLALKYNLRLDRDSSHFVSFGVQPGISFRTINYSKATTDNQWNGSFHDPSLSTGENFTVQSMEYFNLNAGFTYSYIHSSRKKINIGGGFFNLTSPRQSLMGNGDVRLDPRISAYAGIQFKLHKVIDVLPSVHFMSQGEYKEVDVGAYFKFYIKDEKYRYQALYIGGWARTRDAGYAAVGFDYNNWHIGLSYDINFSNLSVASQYQGGFEISLLYIIKSMKPKVGNYKTCPDYM